MLRVRDAARAIEFYANAFGARELMRFDVGGRVAHAELEIGNSLVYLGEEAADLGFPSPQTLGGSPVAMHLSVDDADAAVERAVAAGARVWRPVTDQFYGDRSGQVIDPFGFTWTLAARIEDLSVEEMHARFAALQSAPPPAAAARTYIREGFHTVTPYLIVRDAPALIDFVTRTFDAEETGRFVGAGLHAEVRIGDSMVMIGGGAPPERPYSGQQWTTALHVYVPDTDAFYARALQEGATSIGEPRDMEYGERGAGVKDPLGNVWYIATAPGDRYVPAGLQTVNVYLHPRRAEPVLAFLTRAFGATDVQKFASPDGVVHHASVKVGDTVIEMGEANGPYQPMPTRFYLYVPDCDALYSRALESGATSIAEPADQPYGDRVAGVADAFGNQWHLATRIAE
jgi:PhnB protein